VIYNKLYIFSSACGRCMDAFERAEEFIGNKLAKSGYYLSEFDKAALAAAWSDDTYETIAEARQLNINTLRGHAAPLLWRRLTELFGQKVTKKKFKSIVSHLIEQADNGPETSLPLPGHSAVPVVGAMLPNVETFYGREKDLGHLSQLLQQYSCLVVLGADGVGKKSVVAKLLCAEELSFKKIVWRPLHHLPSAAELEADLLSLVSEDEAGSLISALKQQQVVIVLESLDSLISEPGTRRLDEAYMSLIRRLIEETPSKVIVTTVEPINQLRRQAIRGNAAIYPLGGLGLAEAKAIVGGDLGGHLETVWQAVGGNPLMLKEVANWSDSVAGVDPSIFKRKTIYQGLFEGLYEQIFSHRRLSTVDRNLLITVAQSSQGVAFAKLLQSNPNSALDIQRLLDMGLLQKSPQAEGPVLRIYEFFRQYVLGLGQQTKSTVQA
ncbi:MAG: hypothetical protein AAGE59_21990, partial [Cyanobacteria bacterium P01_F01_bin.86]